MHRYYQTILEDSEKRAELALKLQILDKAHRDHGAIQVIETYVEPKSTIYVLGPSIAVYLNKDSKYYQNKDLYSRIEIGLDYVRRMQREDGTFDLQDCNFYAAPDTAFCIQRLVPSYRLLERYSLDEGCVKLKHKIFDILKDAAYGMAYGGFHTPNHRWAIASMLMVCYNLLKDENLKVKAEEYLNEGIDCNEDGEYAERSAAIYNVVNNAAMITLYEETGNEQYLEYVRRNLEMMLTYFDPDGSIFTGNSTRQDRGKKVYPVGYFYQYLYMAEKLRDTTFEAAAHQIIAEKIKRADPHASDCLDQLMLYDHLRNYPLKACGFPEAYHKYYEGSGSVRVKKSGMSYSILKDATQFLTFQAGSLTVYMKIGASFFDQRSFKVQKIEKKSEDAYQLSYKAKGWYYLPFEKVPETSDWWQMGNENRKKIYIKDLDIIVTVTEKEAGLDVNVRTEGCDRVPLRVEIGVPEGSYIDAKTFYCIGSAGEALLVRDGVVTVTKDTDRVAIGPGFGTHQFIDGKFGSEPRSEHNFTLYFTDFTNFDHTFSIDTLF